MKKVIVFGTRPEFIKLLPLIWEIQKRKKRREYHFIFSGQQSKILKEIITQFKFEADEEINFKDHENSLSLSFAHIYNELNKKIIRLNKMSGCSVIIAQGDTTTTACASMVAFLNNLPFAHVEAGLRTGNIESPRPEEYYRKIISISSSIHFTPTIKATQNLIKEGVKKKNIILTGNTIVDFINIICKKKAKTIKEKVVIVTIHRRENQKFVVKDLKDQILILAKTVPDYKIIWIKHPALEKANLYEQLKNNKNIFVIDSLPVLDLYRLLASASLVITDSGGLQEECPSFNIPTIVIRENTERIETIYLNYSYLIKKVDNSFASFVKIILRTKHPKMKNPYGNGTAAKKIIDFVDANYGS